MPYTNDINTHKPPHPNNNNNILNMQINLSCFHKHYALPYRSSVEASGKALIWWSKRLHEGVQQQ